MNAKEFVDSLFEGYEQTPALADFKEEMLGNLNAKIESLVKNGMEIEAAAAKAFAELGDVSSLANDMSLKKRNQIFEEVYMGTRKYMGSARVVAYIVFGFLALFGIITGAIGFHATQSHVVNMDFEGPAGAFRLWLSDEPRNLSLVIMFAIMLPFLTVAFSGLCFLGLTQETASTNPLSPKRAAWYTAATALIVFGIFVMPLVYFSSTWAVSHVGGFGHSTATIAVISLSIPFILPGIGLLVFLVLTEKNRLKPWALKKYAATQNPWDTPEEATRFGLYSGAIWIFAAGIFFVIGFTIGWKWSWLVFIFAVGFQNLFMAHMYSSKNRRKKQNQEN